MDWNNDGKLDLIAGDTKGNVTLFLNTGTKERPKLAKGKLVKADGKVITAKSNPLAGTYSKLHMADWDGDGLKDLLIGHSSTIVFYRNAGTPSAPRFQAPTLLEVPGGRLPSRPSPYVVDWDGDGKKDLLVGSERAQVFFHRNVGTNRKPKLERGVDLALKGPGFEKGYRCRIEVVDWNNDGKKDLLVGNRVRQPPPSTGGNLWLFLGE